MNGAGVGADPLLRLADLFDQMAQTGTIMTIDSAAVRASCNRADGQASACKKIPGGCETVKVIQSAWIHILTRAVARKNGSKMAENRGDLTHKSDQHVRSITGFLSSRSAPSTQQGGPSSHKEWTASLHSGQSSHARRKFF
jgi:hypothetical protein